jgi:uncharacterized protein
MPHVDRHPPGSPLWFDLATDDLARARAFYTPLFGWTYDEMPAPEGVYVTCRVGDRKAAGMYPRPPGAPWPPMWTVYFGTSDADTAVRRVRELAGTVVVPPTDAGEEGRFTYCQDPTGAHFGLWQPKRHPGAGVVGEPGAMGWCEVNTREMERAARFYAALLGLQARPMETPGMRYMTLNRGEEALCGVSDAGARLPPEVPPHWMPYFAVDDADRAATAATSGGGAVRVPPFDTPFGRVAVIQDPAGAAFSIIRFAPFDER